MDNCSDSDDDAENVFFFESDHLALRGNKEYSNMLRTICILEAQRNKTIKDIEELVMSKAKYLSNTELFLEKITKNEEIVPPMHMTIAQVPEVSAYDIKMPEELSDVKKVEDSDLSDQLVRGRIFDQTKPETFNQLWTCEEQRRLEQLLLEYPAEPIESRRYTKIANALGNRTPLQVASRVQKFFKKLYSAGMPVPGRLPKSRKNACSKNKLSYRTLIRPSTFFPDHNVPVNIPEDDLQSDYKNCNSNLMTDNNYQYFDKSNPNYIKNENPDNNKLIIQILQAIRDEKRDGVEVYDRDSMKDCEICHTAPVSRIQLHCNSCYGLINQCSDCIVDQLLTNKFEHMNHEVVRLN